MSFTVLLPGNVPPSKTELPYIPRLLSWDNSDTSTTPRREMQLFSPMESTLCCAAPWHTLSHQYASGETRGLSVWNLGFDIWVESDLLGSFAAGRRAEKE